MKRIWTCGAAITAFLFCLPFVSYADFSEYRLRSESIERNANMLYQDLMQAGGEWSPVEGLSGEDIRKAYQFMKEEILNGNTSGLLCLMDVTGNVTAVKLKNGTQAINQHIAASAYVDEIWKKHKASIESLTCEKEKADYIAKILVDNYICAYDYGLTVQSIYDLVNTGSRKGTCYVFATLFDRICEKAGIIGYVENGRLKENSSGFHGWNRLEFKDGTAHYYDVTLYMCLSDPSYLDMTPEKYGARYCAGE